MTKSPPSPLASTLIPCLDTYAPNRGIIRAPKTPRPSYARRSMNREPTHRTQRVAVAACTGALLATLTLTGCAALQPKPAQPTLTELHVIDGRATDELKSLTEFLSTQHKLQFDMTVYYDDYKVGDLKVQYGRRVSIKIERPNHAAGVSVGDTRSRRFWYDGAQVTSLDEASNTYTQIDVPDNYDDMVETMAVDYNTPLPVADFLTSGAYDRLMDGVKSAYYLGEHRVGEDLCPHLVFEGEDRDWQVWIMPGDQPVLRKLVVTYKTLPNCPQYIALLQHWNLTPTFDPADFKPAIPDQAIKVERQPSPSREPDAKS